MARVVKLILAERTTGVGTAPDPCRIVPQLFTLDGRLVAEADPHTGNGFLNIPFDDRRPDA